MAFASRTASSSVSTGATATIGPKASSRITPHLAGRIGQQRRGQDRSIPVATAQPRAPLAIASSIKLLTREAASTVTRGPTSVAGSAIAPRRTPGHTLLETSDKIRVDGTLDIDALYARQAWPRAHESADGALFSGQIQIGIGGDQNGADTTQFQVNTLARDHILDVPAEVTARKSDDRQSGIENQARRLVVIDRQHRQSIGRPACRHDMLAQGDRRIGNPRRRFQHNGRVGENRRCDLVGGDQDRPIECGDSENRTDRLPFDDADRIATRDTASRLTVSSIPTRATAAARVKTSMVRSTSSTMSRRVR